MAMTQDDKDKLISLINQLSSLTPAFAKSMMGGMSITQIMSFIPQEFKRYTLGEIMEALQEHEDKRKLW